MNVLVVEPGFAPYEKEIHGLSQMQETVGGLIQAIYPFEEEVAVVCNDEGILLGMPFNRSMEGGYGGVFGPFFVCGLGEEDFCGTLLTAAPMLMQGIQRLELKPGDISRDAGTAYVTPAEFEAQYFG